VLWSLKSKGGGGGGGGAVGAGAKTKKTYKEVKVLLPVEFAFPREFSGQEFSLQKN
jgi:hypothetical protein